MSIMYTLKFTAWQLKSGRLKWKEISRWGRWSKSTSNILIYNPLFPRSRLYTIFTLCFSGSYFIQFGSVALGVWNEKAIGEPQTIYFWMFSTGLVIFVFFLLNIHLYYLQCPTFTEHEWISLIRGHTQVVNKLAIVTSVE